MTTEPLETALTYRNRVMIAVLNAIVGAGQVGDEDLVMVELEEALTGTCDAIAMLVAAARVDQSSKDRRDTADLCRKRILTSADEIARKVAAGEELPWTMDALGTAH